MKLENNLAVVDYAQNDQATREAGHRALPDRRHRLVRQPEFFHQGRGSQKILRQNELPVI
jgi:hypothetical protein